MKIELIIFDLDGTLVKLPIDYADLRQELSKISGLSPDFFKPLLNGILKASHKAKASELLKIVDRYELEAIKRMWTEPNLKDTLFYLKNFGLKLALVTLQGRKAVNAVIKKLKLENVFDSIITREDSYVRKEQIKMVMSLLKVSPEKTMFIADRRKDMKAAKELGIIGVAIRNPKAEAKHFINTIEEVKCILYFLRGIPPQQKMGNT